MRFLGIYWSQNDDNGAENILVNFGQSKLRLALIGYHLSCVSENVTR
jgi:hypothetical protein